MRRTGYTNGVLTVIAVLLGLNVAVNMGETPSVLPAAQAQPADPEGPDTGLISAAEQRKVMIAELRRLGARMERIEAKLNSGLSVKVTEMPALKKDEGDKGN
jgi:hypothetical protein